MTVQENPLDTFLAKRPDVQELVDKNILKDPKIAPSLQQHRDELSKRKIEDTLRHKIDHRPTPEELVEKNILKSLGSVAPALQRPINDLEKADIQHNLEQKIADRPTKSDLLNQGILKEETTS
ncbi:unnamed protein product [Cunninghamella blakesleeana]